MATHEEKLEALNAALTKAGASDAAEAERFLLLWDALLPFIPMPPPRATILVEFEPSTPDEQQEFTNIQNSSMQLVKRIVTKPSAVSHN